VRGSVEHPLVQDAGPADDQWPVDRVALAGEPPDLRGKPEHLVPASENLGVQADQVCQEVGGAVNDSGWALAAVRDVRHAQRVLGRECVEAGGLEARACDQFVVPAIPLVPGDVHTGAPDDDRVLHAGDGGDGLVGARLQREDHAVAPGAVLGDEHSGADIGHALLQRLGRQDGGHDRVHGSEARAGEHRHDGLWEQAHVQRHAVPRLDAEGLQRRCEPADLLGEPAVGEHSSVFGLTFPVERHIAAPFRQVAIEAVLGHVELAAGKP
jgi:hypothetical protein